MAKWHEIKMRKKTASKKGPTALSRRAAGDLDFEIGFYEGLVKDKPDFLDALVCLGDAYTRRGSYRKGLEVDRRLVQLEPENPWFHYNLSCSCSLLGMLEDSARALTRAIKFGYRDFSFMHRDPDLEQLRKTGFYLALRRELVKKK